ncbi:helix-turn-helix domain-containing protein [Streptosporangium amethystogenes]|uniref:helix-turn-helix domain-containing protein n=1 Tax=Streptosporangium amethystogenes TaxID=2002 RepID=UPI0037A55173
MAASSAAIISAALWVSSTTWSRWERGRQEIRPVYRARMAEVFGVDPAEVERWIEGTAPVDTEAWLIPDFSDLSLGATVETVGRLWRCDVDPERRHVLAALPFVPAALGGWLSEWSYGAPVASAAYQGSGAVVGLSDVRRIKETREVFSQMDHRFGAGAIRPAVVDYLHSTVEPLLRGRYDDKVGAALMTAAAGMTLQAGWTAFDLGRNGQAQHYFGQALKLAKVAGDSLTGAWVLTTMTIQALYLEQPSWAVRLARAAVDTAQRAQAPPRVMAQLLSREAWATALQVHMSDAGDGHGAKRVEQLLAEVERLYAQGATDRDPAWGAWFEPTEPVAEAGICWSLIGDHRRSAACVEAVLREYGERRFRSAQLSRVSAVDAYLGLGELEQAIDSVRTAIPMARSLTSPRLVGRIQKFSDRLEPYSATIQVREFRAYLDRELVS